MSGACSESLNARRIDRVARSIRQQPTEIVSSSSRLPRFGVEATLVRHRVIAWGDWAIVGHTSDRHSDQSAHSRARLDFCSGTNRPESINCHACSIGIDRTGDHAAPATTPARPVDVLRRSAPGRRARISGGGARTGCSTCASRRPEGARSRLRRTRCSTASRAARRPAIAARPGRSARPR